MALAFHTMHALADRRVIFTSSAQRVDAYRRALRIGAGFGLGWFHLGSDHAHAVVFCGRERVARWAHDVECAWTLGCGLPVGFGRYHCKPVADQGHLETLVGYVLRQEERHDVRVDPFHLGSNGPDLCGGRVSGWRAREVVQRRVPRFGPARVERILLGGARRRLAEMGAAPAGLVGECLEQRLRMAGASAIGRASLVGRGSASGQAKRALIRVCKGSALGQTVQLPRMLGCSPDRVARLAKGGVDADVLRAVRWQVEFCLTRSAQIAESSNRR